MYDAQEKRMTNYRWAVWGILAIDLMIVLFHRLAMGVVRQDLTSEFGLSSTAFANLGSTYFYSYMLMQIPTGILADYIGARKTVAAGMFLAGMGSILFGFAPSLAWVFFGRLLIGIGVSVVFISTLKTLSMWFQESEYGTMVGLTSFIGNMGALFSQTPLALVVALFTWRSTFAAIGVFSSIIAVLSYIIIRNKPSDLDLPLPADLAGEHRPVIREVRRSLVKDLLLVVTNIRVVHLFLLLAIYNGAFISLTATWGISYLVDIYAISRVSAANYISVVVFGFAVGGVIIGKFSDFIKNRKLPMLLFGGVYALCWAFLIFAGEGKLPLSVILPLFFLLGISNAVTIPIFACTKELYDPEIAGISTSVVNMGGFVGGAVLPIIMGRVIDTYGMVLSSVQLYQKAFFWCLLSAGVGLLLICFVKETNCRNIWTESN